MATTVHEPPKIDSGSTVPQWRMARPAARARKLALGRRQLACLPHRRLGGHGGDHHDLRRLYQRDDRAPGLVHSTGSTSHCPSVLYFDTVILLASSVTLEFARKRIAAFVHGRQQRTVGSATLAVDDTRAGLAVCRPGSTWRGCNCARKACTWPPIPAAHSSTCSRRSTRCTCWADWRACCW